jgi:4-amino-4-deoxy-L-arabinose transferase-like glycosyltransferase
MPSRFINPIRVGIVLGVATTVAYLIGSGRSFGYDAAATFANYVATPNLIDAFAVHSALPSIPLKSIASNDHVSLSLISHVIYSVTGSRSEVVYRLVPAVAAGGTVGVSAAVLAKRFGLLAGTCAGLFIATNPLFVENSRDLRGYSLAALLVLAATLMLIRGAWTRGRLAAYAALLGFAIATHVFAIVVLLVHVVWISMRRSWPELKQLSPAWIGAFVIGAAANANIEAMEFLQHGFPPSLFDPTFPRDLVLFLVGAPVLLTVGLWLSTAGLGLWAARREPWVWAAIAVVGVVVGVLWLVLQPAYLYPRFFIFLIPGVAYLVAAAVQRWKVLAPIVAAGAVAAVVAQVPGYTQDPLALPQAAAAIEQARAGGGEACVIHADEQVLAAYTTDFTVVTRPDQLNACTVVVVVSWNVDLTLRDLAAQEFPRRTALPAYYPAVVLGR